MTSTLIPSTIFSVQPARKARHVRGSRKGMSGGTMKRWSALYGYRVLISHGVTMRSAAQTESYPRASARRAASVRTALAALPEIGRKTPNFNARPSLGVSASAHSTQGSPRDDHLPSSTSSVGPQCYTVRRNVGRHPQDGIRAGDGALAPEGPRGRRRGASADRRAKGEHRRGAKVLPG